MTAIIILISIGVILTGISNLVLHRRITNLENCQFDKIGQRRFRLLLDDFDRFKRGVNFIGKRERFIRQRIDETMKRMDGMDNNFIQFGEFIHRIGRELIAKRK